MVVFSYVKLIILKDLMSILIYYVLPLFHFGTLSFKIFNLILYVFKIYHFELKKIIKMIHFKNINNYNKTFKT